MTDGQALASADQACCWCFGLGRTDRRVCRCVYRAVFNDCLHAYRTQYSALNTTCDGFARQLRVMPGRRILAEDYRADFELNARRVLTDAQHRLFVLHFIERKEYRPCGRLLAMDRGSFFHEVYRITEKLGRVFESVQPYALWPISEYFAAGRKLAAPLAMAA